MNTPLTLICHVCEYKIEVESVSQEEAEFFRLVFKAAHVNGNHEQIPWHRLMKERKPLIVTSLSEYPTRRQATLNKQAMTAGENSKGSARQAEAHRLRFEEGKTYKQIGEALGVNTERARQLTAAHGRAIGKPVRTMGERAPSRAGRKVG